MSARIAFLSLPLLALGAACAKASSPSDSQLTPLPARPLAGYASQQVVMLPTRYLRGGDSLGWGSQVGVSRDYLRGLDDALTDTLTARGQTNWVFAPRVVASARRNAAFATDPYALAAEPLRPGRRRPEQIVDPLASQIRSLVALHNARYALYPVELRFEKVGSAGRAVLHVALVDARLAQVVWSRDVASDTSSILAPSLVAAVAGKLADLIAAP